MLEKDMVLFVSHSKWWIFQLSGELTLHCQMPYLHWDTSRKRQQFAKEIHRIIRKDELDAKMKVKEDKKTRQALRRKTAQQPAQQPALQPALQPAQQRTERHPFWNFSRRSGQGDDNLKVDERGRLQINNKLGQYLLDAARLYEGMTNYRDKTVLREYLTTKPPLHPRRTLDQAYYWILKSTKKRHGPGGVPGNYSTAF